ncbi:MAG: hypothetical protein MJY92_02225 [Bacteroidales bacterium]|nr:hypothetical protein [Bacteroidales bacterium]
MKKIILLASLLLSSLCANAFEFDGIDLNGSYNKIIQEIAKRGYTYNQERNCLQGDCRGQHIYMSANYLDVAQPGHLGQLIVDVPTEGKAELVLKYYTEILNILYHQVDSHDGVPTYLVDKDGTQLKLQVIDGYARLTYNTPYYKVKTAKK